MIAAQTRTPGQARESSLDLPQAVRARLTSRDMALTRVLRAFVRGDKVASVIDAGRLATPTRKLADPASHEVFLRTQSVLGSICDREGASEIVLDALLACDAAGLGARDAVASIQRKVGREGRSN